MRPETLVQGRQRHALSLRDFGKPWDDSAVALIRLNAPGEAPLQRPGWKTNPEPPLSQSGML